MTTKEEQRIKTTKEAMNQKMRFGKYKGQTIAHVAQFDPDYLDWSVGNGLLDKWIITARDRGEYEHRN